MISLRLLQTLRTERSFMPSMELSNYEPYGCHFCMYSKTSCQRLVFPIIYNLKAFVAERMQNEKE